MLCQGDEIICEINGQQVTGTICGKSAIDQPIIGGIYIISPDESIMNDTYPFTHFAMPEINLIRKQITVYQGDKIMRKQNIRNYILTRIKKRAFYKGHEIINCGMGVKPNTYWVVMSNPETDTAVTITLDGIAFIEVI